MKNEIEKQIFEKMKAKDFGESMCNETKLNVLKWTMQQLRKHDVISSCDCLVGFLSGEKVNKSTIDYEVERIVNIQPTFKKYGLLNGEPQTKSQIVDGRKGYLSRFVYCPYCGEKLNWKGILSNCL